MSPASREEPRHFASETGVPRDESAAVLAIVARHAPRTDIAVAPGHHLVADLGFDSLAVVRTVTALEEELDVELPAERLHELRSATVADLAALVEDARA